MLQGRYAAVAEKIIILWDLFVSQTHSCLSFILDVRVRNQGEKRIYHQVFQI